jgi:hypothetical protein
MNTSIFATYNKDRGSVEDRAKHRQEMKTLADKNARTTIIIYPDGSEKEFYSAMAACRALGVSSSVVAKWLKQGGPKTGKFKGYSAKLS